MSKFLHRHSEGWQCARDTAFNRLVSDVQANKFKYKRLKSNNDEVTDELLSDEKFKQYESAVIRDELTGIYNTHYFGQKLDRELKRSKRYKRAFSLVLVSIDRLSQLERLYGNLLVCEILKQEAKMLSRSIREVDFAFRIGLDQFVLILPETYSSQATIVAQRICERTRSRAIHSAANSVIVTVSIGIVAFPTHGRQEKELLSSAFQFLQEAKNAGGNQLYTV